MRAAIYREYGTPGGLCLRGMPVPEPGPDEVLVRVVASSNNDWDYLLPTGRSSTGSAGNVTRSTR